jgi:hypothetical protein
LPRRPFCRRLLKALLDSWDRINVILLNLLRALPEGGLEAKAIESSPSVAELFTKKFLRNWRQRAPVQGRNSDIWAIFSGM